MSPPDALFLQAFEDCTLPVAEWRHRAHLKVAYLYLRQWPFEQALHKMRESIKRCNAAANTPDTLELGYHETVTRAWLQLVYVSLCEQGPAASADEFLDKRPQLLDPKALRLFYSRDRIFSWTAKAEFVEPDLAPLRGTGTAGMTERILREEQASITTTTK